MTETAATISDWAIATFGEDSNDARVVARANEEMAEMLRKITAREDHGAISEEATDTIIVLSHVARRAGRDVDVGAPPRHHHPSIFEAAAAANTYLAGLVVEMAVGNTKAAWVYAPLAIESLKVVIRKCGFEPQMEIDRKMGINRKRKWNLSGDGHGYHVRDKDTKFPGHLEGLGRGGDQ